MTTALTQPAPPTFDVQGHRGCRGLMPENTVPAFLKALDLGVTTLELDVVISKDRQVVVSHEPYFNAAFSIKPDGTPVEKSEHNNLTLYQMNYADIKRYDVGSNGNSAYPEQQKLKTYKPLLSEVIEQAETYRQQKNLPAFSYNIEIKSEESEYDKSQPQPGPFCDLVEAVIRKQLPADRVIIQSFDFAVLKHWHQQAKAGKYSTVRLAALVENLRTPEKNLEELGFKPDIYSPYYRLLGQDRIARLHQQGIRVVPWTVNKRDDMERLKKWGVDGLITDYPDRAKGLGR
ncbi:glycerophosphodiester phosphodiesterase [Spirosoma montaniterrae]|uniref:Glycerophosphodiester phosphodiesterase n=2 Tax=Spirosoma montaniterrae TaxID=1178516 RepID=A0A1P9X4W5_9BACT|nr:glycerophosphodiester phosphodiesterase family protein [Spirosoma montaniterrae]AQG82676.1 glycerophosphodiester phosphodiesterase [Spirosoma montaniterrae]